ncbi:MULTISPECIES: hypothetical protein [Pantoea]|jgi:hypothetical protein|uniref:Uncharacterized protein n=1 Tax=Pantoea brenneri TaxID=472694 RepID=A0A7Y6NGZ0_9GAMM|nr:MULTISPECIES: hypothetical protein [Pantoea]MBZ6396979.1 hypothetical protein [Pantoea sp.]MBZ6440270.1 hypothetical protein [Pantoea sp.]NUY43465.1 hypothetical protein [Pantoea brenneri]NUY50969.1 hypothetical protein [Pantoea brenneri]NUY61300.1 hypothetical protein [Pantoea brenneri]
MRLFTRPISVQLVLGFWFLSDHILLVLLYPTAHHKVSCAGHAIVSLLLGIYFLAEGFARWRK